MFAFINLTECTLIYFITLETSIWPNFHYFEPAQNRRCCPSDPPPLPTCSLNYSHNLKCVRLVRKTVNTGMFTNNLQAFYHFNIPFSNNRMIRTVVLKKQSLPPHLILIIPTIKHIIILNYLQCPGWSLVYNAYQSKSYRPFHNLAFFETSGTLRVFHRKTRFLGKAQSVRMPLR